MALLPLAFLLLALTHGLLNATNAIRVEKYNAAALPNGMDVGDGTVLERKRRQSTNATITSSGDDGSAAAADDHALPFPQPHPNVTALSSPSDSDEGSTIIGAVSTADFQGSSAAPQAQNDAGPFGNEAAKSLPDAAAKAADFDPSDTPSSRRGTHGGATTREHSKAARGQQGGECGQKMFCGCKDRMRRSHPELCKVTVAQCEKTFCNPLCLRMAWAPRVWANCDKVPSWAGCALFAEELEEASEAIAAQFRAHVCSRELSCCGAGAVSARSDDAPKRHVSHLNGDVEGSAPAVHAAEGAEARLMEWVENRVFGDRWPESRLPVRSCREAPEAARAASCALCRGVVEAELGLDPSRCLPPSKDLTDVTPLSLHERCLFLSDRVSARQERLRHELSARTCACAGCCEGQCFFEPRAGPGDRDWLGEMVERISGQIAADINIFGARKRRDPRDGSAEESNDKSNDVGTATAAGRGSLGQAKNGTAATWGARAEGGIGNSTSSSNEL
jgi:hypothetical protein